jgi:hypothetical protein
VQNPRLIQLSFVICAASLALGGCGSLLVCGDLQSNGSQTRPALVPVAHGTQTNRAAVSRSKEMRRFIKEWSPGRKDRAR